MSKEKPDYKAAREFCQAYLGRDCFAPFTGQDASGWHAFVYLVQMWGRGDYVGRDAAIIAMRAVLSGVQSKECIHQVFCQTIPAILDWSHVEEIWPQLLQGGPGPIYRGTNWDLVAVREVTEAQKRREAREDARRRAR